MREEISDATEEEDPVRKCRLTQNVGILGSKRGRHRERMVGKELPFALKMRGPHKSACCYTRVGCHHRSAAKRYYDVRNTPLNPKDAPKMVCATRKKKRREETKWWASTYEGGGRKIAGKRCEGLTCYDSAHLLAGVTTFSVTFPPRNVPRTTARKWQSQSRLHTFVVPAATLMLV